MDRSLGAYYGMSGVAEGATGMQGMDPHLVGVFKNELEVQIGYALVAADQMNSYLHAAFPDTTSSMQFWQAANTALGAMATIGNILWPAQDRAGSKRRGQMLRGHLGVGDDSILGLHKVRNGLVHVDERIDRWFRNSEKKNFLAHAIAPKASIGGVADSDFARHFDPETKIIRVFGEELNFQSAVDDVVALRDLLSR